MGVASSLLFLLLLFSLLGSLLPQLPPSIVGNPARRATWLAAARERWGPAIEGLYRWGFLTLSRFPLFVALLVLTALSTLSCTLSRWRAAWRQAFHRSLRFPAAHLPGSHTVTLPSLPAADLRAALEERGYRVRAASEGEVTCLRADRYGLSGLATLVTHLAVLLLVVAYGLSGWLGWRAEVAVGPGEVAAVGRGTGLAVRNDGFTVAHYPDGSVADYRAQVALLAGDRVVAEGVVRVNGPLRFRGLGVYLMGFREREGGGVLTLQVVHDPGEGVALAGGLLLLAGVTATVYLPHRWVIARLERGQTVLTVRSSGRDDGVEAELTALARELAGC